MFKLSIAAIFLLLCATLPPDVLASGRVNSFIYHRFDNFRYPSTNISAKVFRAQLRYLKEQDYTVLGLEEVARRLQTGKPLPKRGAALSVDDAFTTFAEVAMPILREFGFPVTLFVNTDAVGAAGYLTWSQLKALHQEGVEIGNHSATHAYLVERKARESTAQWRERVRNDILRAQAAFAKHLGIRPTIFAYPYGEYDPELLKIIKELGFQAAFAQQSGVIHAGQNRFLLPRFPMGGPYATLNGFKNKLAMLPLLVSEVQPLSPLLNGSKPPVLRLKIEDKQVDLRRINCFVQGENSCTAEPLSGRKDWYIVRAAQPLSGRRNKYTLTAQDQKGGWHWYSHLWLNAVSPVEETVGRVRAGSESAAQPQAGTGKAGESVLSDQ